MKFRASIGKLLALAVCASADQVSAQQISSSAAPAQLAAAIARTMDATKPAAGSSITLSITSHDNVVDSRTTFGDATAFANIAAHRNDLQVSTTRYMCSASRRAYLDRGVVFENVFAGPGAAGSFSFVIDARACGTLAAPVSVDAASLQELTDAVAQQLTTRLPKERPFPGSRFKKLTVQGDTIQVIYLIAAPAFVDFFKLKAFEVRGRMQGFFCTSLVSAIRQGLKMRVIYTLGDGPPIVEFQVDNFVC